MNDVIIARRYLSKVDNARANNVPFLLTFNQYKKLILKKRCHYTHVSFSNESDDFKISLDRLDNSKGYEDGNVVACLKVVNNIKAILENPNNPVTSKGLKRLCEIMIDNGV